MEITKDSLNNFSDKKIYNYLLNEINGLYDKYNYLGISSEIIDKIIFEEIALSRNNYKDKYDYKKYVISRIEVRIIVLGSKIFNDSDFTYDVIDKYINESFLLPDNYDVSRDYLKILSNLFSKFNYIPEPNTIINLINNNFIFSKILELVVARHFEYFHHHSIFQLFNDNNIVSLIGIYCMIKEISISDNNIEESDNFSTDSLQEYYKEISKIPEITVFEMQELCKRIKQGDEEARNRMVEGNLKLVVSLARRIYNVNNSVPILDLVEAGNIGLMKATSKFDIDLGFRFSTYAAYWIRSEIGREIKRNGLLSYVSLNDYIDDDGEVEIGDMVYNDNFADGMEFRQISGDIYRLFKKCQLTKKQIMVLSLRYGFYDGDTRTLEEIANMFGVKRQAISQQEARALCKLRMHSETKQYAEYMDDPKRALIVLDRFKKAYYECKINRLRANPLEDDSFGYNIVKRRVK